jgi:hypothetical protein
MFRIRRQEKKVSGTAASAVTVTISLVTNRKHLVDNSKVLRRKFVALILVAVVVEKL